MKLTLQSMMSKKQEGTKKIGSVVKVLEKPESRACQNLARKPYFRSMKGKKCFNNNEEQSSQTFLLAFISHRRCQVKGFESSYTQVVFKWEY